MSLKHPELFWHAAPPFSMDMTAHQNEKHNRDTDSKADFEAGRGLFLWGGGADFRGPRLFQCQVTSHAWEGWELLGPLCSWILNEAAVLVLAVQQTGHVKPSMQPCFECLEPSNLLAAIGVKGPRRHVSSAVVTACCRHTLCTIYPLSLSPIQNHLRPITHAPLVPCTSAWAAATKSLFPMCPSEVQPPLQSWSFCLSDFHCSPPFAIRWSWQRVLKDV